MACCARACVVGSSWKQAANIWESKELSCGGKGPPNLAGPADVTGGRGGNCSVCDREARLCRIGSSHNDPRCSDCPVPSDRVLFPRAQRERAGRARSGLSSGVTLLLRGTHRTVRASTVGLLPAGPLPNHTHTHTRTQPAHRHTAAGGRAPWQMHTSAGARWAVLSHSRSRSATQS